MRAALLKLSVFALLAWALTRVSTPVHASMVEALDLAKLVEQSEQVVVARVISQDSHYDDHGRIVTDVQMQVERVEKGDLAPGASLVIRRLGGVVNGLGMRIEGEPTFENGELVLVFGAHNGKNPVLRPVGMSQGVMRIVEKSGVRWVQSAAQGVSLVRRGASGSLERAQVAVNTPRKLDEVLAEIASLVAQKQNKKK